MTRVISFPGRYTLASAAFGLLLGTRTMNAQTTFPVPLRASSGGWYGGMFTEFSVNHRSVYAQHVFEGYGRGFHVAQLNETNGHLVDVKFFDTYWSRGTGVAHTNLINHVQSIPDGRIVMIGVADEAGLNRDNSGEFINASYVSNVVNMLRKLGASKAGNISFRASYALIARKGASHEVAEAVSGERVDVDSTINLDLPTLTMHHSALSIKSLPDVELVLQEA